jgi:protein O-GlcNAc transferase
MFQWLKGKSRPDPSSEARAYVKVGYEAFEKGDQASARAAFDQALQADPRNVDARFLLARLDLSSGDLQAALAGFDAALEIDRDNALFHFSRAEALWRLGRLEDACRGFEEGLARDSGDANWWNLLGRILLELGRLDDAIDVFRRAVAAVPTEPALHWMLGTLLVRRGGDSDAAVTALLAAWRCAATGERDPFDLSRFLIRQNDPDEVAALCRRVLAAEPDHPGAGAILGLLLFKGGQLDEALTVLERAAARADSALALTHLGIVRRAARQPEQALAALEKAHAIAPEAAPVLVELGSTLTLLSRFTEAEVFLSRAIAADPTNVEAHQVLAEVLIAQRSYDDAELLLEKANVLAGGEPRILFALSNLLLQRNRFAAAARWLSDILVLTPDSARAHSDLGVALAGLRQYEEAQRQLERAIELAPGLVEPHINLSSVQYRLQVPTQAEKAARAAIAIDPAHADALLCLANALQAQGRYEESVPALRRVIEVLPHFDTAWSNLMLALNYVASSTPESLLEEHVRVGRRPEFAIRRTRAEFSRDRRPGRRLRVGYVSPDFRNHVVGHFVKPVLRAHDAGQIDLYCYFTGREPDIATPGFRDLAAIWREIADMPDDDAERVMLDDQLDIVVDLAGHTGFNRLGLLARRVAPVQVTWLGYPGGTGIPAIDWRVSDEVSDPSPEADAHQLERVYRMPDVFLVYAPAPEMPEVAAAPVIATGRINFGVYNNYQKVSDEALACWKTILDRVPGSTLTMKTPTLGDEELQARVLARLVGHGFDPDRVRFLGPVPGFQAHLRTLADIDIALDTFPYNGTTTTCESLWMGVPVVAMLGDRHASRVSASLLSVIGQHDLIASDAADYVERAVALATNTPRLVALRSSLRPAMAASPLTDVPRFARALEAAYRHMWKEWLDLTDPA